MTTVPTDRFSVEFLSMVLLSNCLFLPLISFLTAYDAINFAVKFTIYSRLGQTAARQTFFAAPETNSYTIL